MDKTIMEALKGIITEDQVAGVASVIKEMVEASAAKLEGEYNKTLEETYQQLALETAENEKVAYQGYQEAYEIIADLRSRLETQKEELTKQIEEGYEEAYQMLLTEKAKNDSLEVEIYEEYDNKLSEMKSYIVEKVHQFLQTKGAEFYEQAKNDVVNDPRLAEHKVVLEKIVDLTSNYLGDGAIALSSTKLEESNKKLEQLSGQMKMLEARNIRLSTENTKLNESVKKMSLVAESKTAKVAQVVKEQQEEKAKAAQAKVISEQKERAEKAEKASGRGRIVTENLEVIKESNNNDDDSRFEEMLILSGVKKAN